MFFFFNDTATTEIYTLSLHDALPIYGARVGDDRGLLVMRRYGRWHRPLASRGPGRESELFSRRAEPGGRQLPDIERSEEHTSELQSQSTIVYRLLLGKQNHMTIKLRS